MSQAKVDQRKYQKKHRKEIERKKKISTAIKCIVAALILGVFIGIPAGLSIYKSIPRYVGDSSLESFVKTYFTDTYSEDLKVLEERLTTSKENAAQAATTQE